MSRITDLKSQFSRAGLSLRENLHSSVEKTNGRWWIPTIAVCVVWALIDRSKVYRS
jgi:hypothetical protein